MKPGLVLQGKYRLTSLLGEGGMGAVWRAEHLGLGGAPVAVKLMHAREAASPEIRARFDAEANTAASLRSPHVVQVFDFGVDPETQNPFIVMELLEGESLKDKLERAGPLAPPEVARIVTHIARALTRAHEIGVIHRDLKPANVFLVRNDDAEVAKVLDFGIAKRSLQLSPHRSTATGMLLGTPHYMSPEQIKSSKAVDQRTDLWSLGIIAVECLTGKMPFDADNLPGLAMQICAGNVTPPSGLGRVPAGFDAWFARATAADPAQRFESAARMATELRELCGLAPEAQGVLSPIAPKPVGSQAATPQRVTAQPVQGVAEPRRPEALASVGPLSNTYAAAHSERPPIPKTSRRGWAVAGALVVLLSGGALYLRLASNPVEPAAEASVEPQAEVRAAAPVPLSEQPESAKQPIEPATPTPAPRVEETVQGVAQPVVAPVKPAAVIEQQKPEPAPAVRKPVAPRNKSAKPPVQRTGEPRAKPASSEPAVMSGRETP